MTRSGPGWLVTAAFIGPGTVTTATLAGADFGTALLWTFLFATLATIALQEMAARLGLVTGRGLGEAIRRRFRRPLPRALAVALVIGAIGVGNAAYETGNLLGSALGLEGLVGGDVRAWAGLTGALAFALLWSGSYRAVERFMIAMVMVMSAVFMATALVVLPPAGEVLAGLVPRLPEAVPGGVDPLLVALGLIGTTVVPYNLFLHAAAVREKWSGADDLPAARRDLALAIGVGGLVSATILLTAAGGLAGTGGGVGSAADMARQLEPLLGRWAGAFFALGLFAAGVTSTITAPLAAAYATAGALGWPRDLGSRRLRAVWMGVLLIGVAFALSGVRPIGAIVFAQALNGVLLPAVAIFLLIAVNDRAAMGEHANGVGANLAGAAVVLVALVLGGRMLLTALGVL